MGAARHRSRSDVDLVRTWSSNRRSLWPWIRPVGAGSGCCGRGSIRSAGAGRVLVGGERGPSLLSQTTSSPPPTGRDLTGSDPHRCYDNRPRGMHSHFSMNGPKRSSRRRPSPSGRPPAESGHVGTGPSCSSSVAIAVLASASSATSSSATSRNQVCSGERSAAQPAPLPSPGPPAAALRQPPSTRRPPGWRCRAWRPQGTGRAKGACGAARLPSSPDRVGRHPTGQPRTMPGHQRAKRAGRGTRGKRRSDRL
jgi:hypothetical protein